LLDNQMFQLFSSWHTFTLLTINPGSGLQLSYQRGLSQILVNPARSRVDT
jgi:hypothetical protein